MGAPKKWAETMWRVCAARIRPFLSSKDVIHNLTTAYNYLTTVFKCKARKHKAEINHLKSSGKWIYNTEINPSWSKFCEWSIEVDQISIEVDRISIEVDRIMIESNRIYIFWIWLGNRIIRLLPPGYTHDTKRICHMSLNIMICDFIDPSVPHW